MERAEILQWIEQDIFRLDATNLDPGRVTIRRLNREEYRNTIFDLFGIQYPTRDYFPPDDTGYGFDTIGDVLSLSPILFEKYLKASQEIVSQVIPLEQSIVTNKPVTDIQFTTYDGQTVPQSEERLVEVDRPLNISLNISRDGKYRIEFSVTVKGVSQPDDSAARINLHYGDKELISEKLADYQQQPLWLSDNTRLISGQHSFQLSLDETPHPSDNHRAPTLKVEEFRVVGPLDDNLNQYDWRGKSVFFKGPAVGSVAEQRDYAQQMIERLALRLYRRPIDEDSLNQLLDAVMEVAARENHSLEHGIAHAMTAMLTSSRFLYRAEIQPEPNSPGTVVPVDEFALASRLSFLLWNSTPDDQLLELAGKGQLRGRLKSEIDRLLSDSRSLRFYQQFVGQWLQTKDAVGVNISAKHVIKLPPSELRTRQIRTFSKKYTRNAMRQETELLFQYLVNEQRPLTELLTADYTFLNEWLARLYEIEGVVGEEMRRVELPPDANRRGILAHGSLHTVTSNPTRTSPVKRGLFLLENILGTPAPPAPADVPSIEEVQNKVGGDLNIRQLMEVHREDALCASCHSRMDPLGLALENFTAISSWRESENGIAIDTSGQLITGETFQNYQELADVIVTKRKYDFYRCVTEKLLTYALGRGLEYYDVPSVEQIVTRLDEADGNTRELIYAVVDSAPFQKRRGDGSVLTTQTPDED
ncbi:DUF1592 domain-containing protein [Calycomorphotria hydatis]|nr:DUF1592 domain-containing protein [Calycomorphotria hydatis]